jgi:hypothetical protein
MSGEMRIKEQWPSKGPISSAKWEKRKKNALFSFLLATLPSKNTL